jgi:uridine phosphorylase
VSFPNYPGKYTFQSVLTAQDTVAYRRRAGRMPRVDDLKGVLLCLERGLPRRLRWQIPIQQAGSMNGDLYAVKRTRNKVAVMANFGAGSPMVASLAEELIAMGAQRLVLLTGGGGLQPDLRPGDIVVCSQAIRDEGTSYHYLPPGKYVNADSDLMERLEVELARHGKSCTFGTTWTTDAGFRETVEEVQRYQAEGVKTVEMETAGLYAVGQVRDIPVAAVVVVMDSLADGRWKAPDQGDAIQRSLESAYAAAIDVLAG